MSSIEQRIGALERQTESKAKHKQVLFDSNNMQLDAAVIRMPTADVEGLARLPDGSEMPILHESGWQSIQIMIASADCDEKATDGKLRVRRDDVHSVILEYAES